PKPRRLGKELQPLARNQPSVVFGPDIVTRARDRILLGQGPEPRRSPWRVVLRCPAAIGIGEMVEAARIPLQGTRHVIIVVGAALQSSSREHSLVDAVGVHVVDQVLHAGARTRIWDRGLVWPAWPHMSVAVDDQGHGSLPSP